ncbi:rac GTPase-activating protein 1-like [Pristis pectinata]|uniref:rac GTPase-activating protein 1-like n=1 Tax=Pristis pectinata TaxID=685728 RepID=UPI00223E5180|nr:rac GTPase-activating protein 1-like [Pristis pectinata]
MMMRFKDLLEQKLDALLCLAECITHRNEQAMYQLALNFESCRKKWKMVEEELSVSRSRLVEMQLERASLEVHLKHARHQLDIELKRRHKAELACEQLERRLQLVHDMLKSEGPAAVLQIQDRENLLNVLSSQSRPSRRLPAVEETLTSTLSLSGISYDRTSDEIPALAMTGRGTRPRNRDRRSSTRILVDSGPVSARRSRSSSELVLELAGSPLAGESVNRSQNHNRSSQPVAPRRRRSLMPEPVLLADGSEGDQQTPLTTPAPLAESRPVPEGFVSPENKAPTRPHNFVSKTIIRLESCVPCGKRIRFGKMALKCRTCCLVSHPDCRRLCPTLCAPNFTLTMVKNGEGTIADFAPPTAPMIPSLIIHCINEIEQRGLQEPGIYRVSGCEQVVRQLKEHYVRGKGLPVLSRVTNIHVVCGLLKDFLRKLKEPLVTFRLHPTFLAASGLPADRCRVELCRAIAALPPANRDTLGYLLAHLQRVMGSPDCRMDQRNLARVFGPTLVGHAKPDPHPLEVFEDTKRQPEVVEHLLSLPSEFWSRVVSTGSGAGDPNPFTHGCLFKPLTSPDVAKMTQSPGCCLPPGLLSLPGTSHPGKLFPSPTLK